MKKTIQTEALVAVTSVDWSDKNIGKIKKYFSSVSNRVIFINMPCLMMIRIQRIGWRVEN